MIPTDVARRFGWLVGGALLVSACLSLAGCSGAAKVPEQGGTATVAGASVAPSPVRTAAPPAAHVDLAPAGARAAPRGSIGRTATAGSRVLSKKDIMLRVERKRVCEIRFVYGTTAPDTVLWEEPCAKVTAKMIDRRELEALGKWDRLDDFERKFVAALPGGRVLYVGGEFTASIYPIGTTNDTYEVPISD